MNVTIKIRLILLGTILAFVPTLIISLVLHNTAMNDASVIVKKDKQDKLIALRDVTATTIEDYITLIQDQIISFSSNLMVVEAMESMDTSFHNYVGQISDADIAVKKSTLKDFYNTQFDVEYKALNTGKTSSPNDLFEKAGKPAWALQGLYISENPAPLGEKDSLIDAGITNDYTQHHSKFHPIFRQYQQLFDYYDIFLVDAKEGHIIYSVYKELDYATSLKSGPYADSAIGEAYRKALSATDKDQTFLTDFSSYTPSYNKAASFISSPIFDKDTLVGILIFQMPVDRINRIMNHNNDWEHSGLGKTGETYLIGENKTMRSNSRRLIENKEDYLASLSATGVSDVVLQNLKEKESSISLQSVDTIGVQKALSGETGFSVFENIYGHNVFSAYKPLDIKDLNWVIMSEVDESETLYGLDVLNETLFKHILVFVCIFLVVGTILGWLLAVIIIKPINHVIDTIFCLSEGEGDLTKRLEIKGKDETAKLSQGINLFIGHIDTTFSAVLDSVVRLIPISKDMADVNHKISESSHKQKLHSEKINSLLISTNESTQVVDEKLGQIRESTESGNKVVKNTSKAMEDVHDSMDILSDNVTQAVAAIDTLTEDTDRISGIIDVINGIAEQTNLLALNAAIEAARAGEAGRGFAVVADEVRSLASKTRQSTNQVTEMVNTIQSSTQSVVTLMANSQSNADKSSKSVNQATQELALVNDAMVIIFDRVKDIDSALKNQQSGFMEINDTYELMNLSFQESEAAGEESTLVGADIEKLGDTIMNKISVFTVTNKNWSTNRRNKIRIKESNEQQEK
ncbi:MAG: methyl-accepting chemotaxis protein [Marinomonas colpomeniae]